MEKQPTPSPSPTSPAAPSDQEILKGCAWMMVSLLPFIFWMFADGFSMGSILGTLTVAIVVGLIDKIWLTRKYPDWKPSSAPQMKSYRYWDADGRLRSLLQKLEAGEALSEEDVKAWEILLPTQKVKAYPTLVVASVGYLLMSGVTQRELEDELNDFLDQFRLSIDLVKLPSEHREYYRQCELLWGIAQGKRFAELAQPIPLEGTLLQPDEYPLYCFPKVCLQKVVRLTEWTGYAGGRIVTRELRPKAQQADDWKAELKCTRVDSQGRLLVTSSRLIFSSVARQVSIPLEQMTAVRSLGGVAVSVYTKSSAYPLYFSPVDARFIELWVPVMRERLASAASQPTA